MPGHVSTTLNDLEEGLGELQLTVQDMRDELSSAGEVHELGCDEVSP